MHNRKILTICYEPKLIALFRIYGLGRRFPANLHHLRLGIFYKSQKMKKKNFLILLACLVTVYSVIFFSRISDYLSDKLAIAKKINSAVDSKNKRKTDAVILLTTMRSGSSIVGSIFDQRYNVTYLYEPLFPFGESGCGNDIKNNVMSLLRSAATCHFENFKELYQPTNRDDTWARYENGNFLKRKCTPSPY